MNREGILDQTIRILQAGLCLFWAHQIINKWENKAAISSDIYELHWTAYRPVCVCVDSHILIDHYSLFTDWFDLIYLLNDLIWFDLID